MQSIKRNEISLNVEKDFIITLVQSKIVDPDADSWSWAAACFIIERKSN